MITNDIKVYRQAEIKKLGDKLGGKVKIISRLDGHTKWLNVSEQCMQKICEVLLEEG